MIIDTLFRLVRVMQFKIEKRIQAPATIKIAVLLLSLAAGFCFASVIFLVKGVHPVYALSKILSGSFGSLYGLKETVAKSIPLMLTGVGLTVAYRGKFWNIGAEGQLLFGAIAATWIALKCGANMPSYAVIPLMFGSGFVGGALWGIIPAIMKTRFRINEVITTLMFNYIAAEFVQFLVYGPWKGKSQWGFPYTDNFPPAATLSLIPSTRIHYITLIIALAVIAIAYFIIMKTNFGYEIRVIGDNPDAGKYAGISFTRTTIVIMILSGGFAGLAGVGEVAGVHHHLTYPWTISSGYGFTSIIVAWLAKLNPVYVMVSSFFLGGILIGGDTIQTSFGLPYATVNIFNGLILLFLIMGDFFLEYKIRIAGRRL